MPRQSKRRRPRRIGYSGYNGDIASLIWFPCLNTPPISKTWEHSSVQWHSCISIMSRIAIMRLSISAERSTKWALREKGARKYPVF
jgi:hypothetical protein